MKDALIRTICLQTWDWQFKHRIEFVIDDLRDAVAHVALRDEAGCIDIAKIRRAHGVVAQLVNQVALKNIAALLVCEHRPVFQFRRDGRIHRHVRFTVVVRKRVVVGQIEDELVFQFLNGHIRRIGTRHDLEAVVEERLRLVVGQTQQLHTLKRLTARGPRPDHAHGDVVVVPRFQGEGAGRLQEQTITGRVSGAHFRPWFNGDTYGAPLVRVGISGEHVIRGNVEVRSGGSGQAVAPVGHALPVFPEPAHVVVVLCRQRRLAVDAKVPVVVNELPHAVTLVVDDAVTVTDANALIGNAE